jgi:hypothetical protein
MGGEARIVLEARDAERGADVLHGMRLERADQHQRAVRGLEHAGERHRAPVQLGPAHHLGGGLLGLRGDHRVEQRHIELLAPTGLLPLQQREQHALEQMHSGRVVREGRGIDHDRIALARAPRHHAGHRLRQHVLTAFVRIGAGEAEAGTDRVDQPRIDLAQLLIAEAHAVHHAGAEIVHHHVGAADQVHQRRPIIRLAQVEHHRALVAVERAIDRADQPGRIVGNCGARQVTGRRALDLDHVGAVVAEHLRRDRPHHHLGEVDDPDAGKRQFTGCGHAACSIILALAEG